MLFFFFFSSRRRHTRFDCDWSSDVCSSDLTSYAEVVLAPPAADAAHPTFSNLSVETECVPELDTLLATRRPRSRSETQVWLAHVAVVEVDPVGALQWETDRARFLGRGRRIRTPAAVI